MNRKRWASIAIAALALAAGTAQARSTLDETIRDQAGAGYHGLEAGPGEPYVVREAGIGRARGGRANRRQSLAFFSQLTDPQIADEMSPARIEVVDPASGVVSASWRPQEAFGTQVLDQIVRSVNANRTSPLEQGAGRGRARLGFAVLTGDQPDNQQLNEVRWFLGVMNGDRIDPFSGQPLSAENPCGQASEEETAQLDAAVAARRYTGIQDYDDYPGESVDRYEGYWDPEQAVAAGPYQPFPRYPGLMERAQQPFQAEGLRVPWYTSRGNHDGLIQGNIAANSDLFVGLATSCTKIFPGPAFDPATLRGKTSEEVIATLQSPETLAALLEGVRLVPPDPDRRFLSMPEYKELHRGGDESHGFGFISSSQERASAGTAGYYSHSPAPGMQFIALDTVAEGGGANGNVDDPQYQWLRRELDRNTAVHYGSRGGLIRDGDRNRLIVVYGHHTLGTMDNRTPDEDAGPCTDPPLPGCDADPRDSQPIHRGEEGRKSIESLLLRYPNVIAAVTGHTHYNKVNRYRRQDNQGGFWQVNTASHVDYPQQSRLIEVMNNRDGTLSLFGTVLDQAAPVAAPPPGDSAGFSDTEVASLSRELSANDPQRLDVTAPLPGEGKRKDRNVELLIRNPRRLGR